jgi:hypothetical protein
MDIAERERALVALRAPRPVPAVLTPARLARPGEVPAAASLLVKAAVEPWHTQAYYAVGPVPYTWERKAGGYMSAASISVRLNHPDGRAAVAVWVVDTVKRVPGRGPRKGHEGPATADRWELGWSSLGAWCWRVCECDARPRPHPGDVPQSVGVLDLRAALAADTSEPIQGEQAA